MKRFNAFKYHVSYANGKISIELTLFSVFIVVSFTCRVHSCMPFVAITTFSAGLVGCRDFYWNYQGWATVETSTPAEYVVIATKGLQEWMGWWWKLKIKVIQSLIQVKRFTKVAVAQKEYLKYSPISCVATASEDFTFICH